MKIGILTFHCAYNYGAVLQAYALQEYLRLAGYDVEIIDYCPEYLATRRPSLWAALSVRHPIKTVKRLLRFKDNRRNYDRYVEFAEKYLVLSRKVSDISSMTSLLDTYSHIIVGSDQVWNEKYNGHDPVWYAAIKKEGQKYISYAASAGNIMDSDIESLSVSLSQFYAVSVREESTRVRLMSQTDIHITTVLDPSLLIDSSCWSKWMKPEAGRYILVYQGRMSSDAMRIASSLAAANSCEVISVDNYPNSFMKGVEHRDVGPDGFMSLIMNAVCVITTSFHGTALSISAEVPFYTVRLDDGADSRSYELLESLGISDRMISKDASVDLSEPDYSQVRDKLNVLRESSRIFLFKNLNG